MNRLKKAVLWVLLLASASLAAAQTTEAASQNEAKLTLHVYGQGYARALLDGAVPNMQLTSKDGKPWTVKLANGEIHLAGGSGTADPNVHVLKLTRGDFQDLGLQIGLTPVDALIRQYGKPEKQDGQRLIYRGIAEICVDHLVFHVRQGLLQGIEWDWCYD
jgi:hypothetical protein